MIEETDMISRNQTILSVDVHDETVLFSAKNGMYYNLSATSREIWVRLADPIRVGSLYDDLTSFYGGERAVIAADAGAFLLHLQGLGVVEVTRGPVGSE